MASVVWTSRVERQYNATDPENRLVADELERRWNTALQRVAELEQRLTQRQHRADVQAVPETVELIDLADDLAAVWHDEDADMRLKKRIVRTLIREIMVDVDRQAGEATLVIHWQGGVHTKLQVPVRKRGSNSRHTAPQIVEAVRQLALVCRDPVIAGILNRNGLLTGTGNRWTKERVTSLRSHHEIPCYASQKRISDGWMNLTEAADLIGVSAATLRSAVERGEIKAIHPLADGPWIFNREELACPAVDRLVERAKRRCGAPAKPDTRQRNLGFSST